MRTPIFLITLIFSFSFATKQSFASEKNSESNQTKITSATKSVDDLDDAEFEISSSGNEIKIDDPLEKYNRKVYAFNDYFDRYLFQRVSMAYRQNVPNPARKSIRNFITNIYLPVSAINSLLQGKVDNCLANFSHFLINSTIGIGGLFDVASKKKIHYNYEDFGQTLGYYKISSGPYLMLPFIGPSSVRDLSGIIVDKSVNPLDFGLLEINGQTDLIDPTYRIGLSTVSAVDKRESLLNIIDDIRKESFDPYATIRSAYIQKRLTETQK